MKTVLLGPHGQLGIDIIAANERRGTPLSILGIDRAKLDLSDIDTATRLLGELEFCCLINCAGYHKTDEVERNAQLAFTINTHLVGRLAEICAKKRARFVHISTDYVFGGQTKRSPLAETDARAPLNVYGASKSVGEDLALSAWQDVIILRVASLFGIAGASGKGGNFVNTIIRLARETGPMNIVCDQTMSPTSTADVADVLVTLLTTAAPAGIWHVVNSGAATWYEFAIRIIGRVGLPAVVAPIKSAEFEGIARRPPYSVLDNSKLRSEIGPMRSWQDALDAYLLAKQYELKKIGA